MSQVKAVLLGPVDRGVFRPATLRLRRRIRELNFAEPDTLSPATNRLSPVYWKEDKATSVANAPPLPAEIEESAMMEFDVLSTMCCATNATILAGVCAWSASPREALPKSPGTFQWRAH